MPGVVQSHPSNSRVRRNKSKRKGLSNRRDLAGYIAWLPPRKETKEDPDGDDGYFNHPVVLLSSAHENGKVDVLVMTSLQNTELSTKFPRNINVRRHYLPISPSPTHPDNGILLKLRHDCPPLDRSSYINTENRRIVKIASLRPYKDKDHGHPDYFLSQESYLILRDYHHGTYNPQSSSPPPSYDIAPAWGRQVGGVAAIETTSPPPPRYQDLAEEEATTGLHHHQPSSTRALPLASSSRSNTPTRSPAPRTSTTQRGPSLEGTSRPNNPERQRLLDEYRQQHLRALTERSSMPPPPRYGATAVTPPSTHRQPGQSQSRYQYQYPPLNIQPSFSSYSPSPTPHPTRKQSWQWWRSWLPSFSSSSSPSPSTTYYYPRYSRSSSSSSSSCQSLASAILVIVGLLAVAGTGYAIYLLGAWVVHVACLFGDKIRIAFGAVKGFFGETVPGKFGELGGTVRGWFGRILGRG